MTWNDLLVLVLEEKTRMLINAGLNEPELFLTQNDKEEIMNWDEKICEKVFKQMKSNIEKSKNIFGLNGLVCPFCVYADICKIQCIDCVYGKNHGICDITASDTGEILIKCKNINYYLSNKFYKELFHKLLKLKECKNEN